MLHIKISDPNALELDGKYLVEYDPSRPGGKSPLGYDLLVHIVVTDDPAKARSFNTVSEAFAYWRQPYGIREDGKPNRPLTVFMIELTGVGEYQDDTRRKSNGVSRPLHDAQPDIR